MRSNYFIPFDRLPEGFAESLERPQVDPAPARPAATIVLMRDAPDGPEALLLRRNRSAGFVPGAYVFPGGRVDRSDGVPGVIARVDGLTPAQANGRLAPDAGGPPGIAYYLAAVREAFEETGILVGSTSAGEPPRTAAQSEAVDDVRHAVLEDRVTFAEALDSLGCRVDGGAMEYLAHWITPEPEPRRYDTRFFLAKVPADSKAIVDAREMTDALWLRPAEAVDRQERGELPMVFPTIETLKTLTGFEDVDAVLAELGPRPVPTIMPKLVVTPTGVAMDLGEVP